MYIYPGIMSHKFQAYYARIVEVNGKLRAVTEFNPDAWEIAAMLDSERVANRTRG